MKTFKKQYAWVLDAGGGKVFNIEIPLAITVHSKCLEKSDRLEEFLEETLPKGVSLSGCQWMVNDGCWNCVYLRGGE